MKMKQFRSILALTVVAAPIIVSLLPAQAIPMDEVLDSAGKAFVRGMFGISGERQESPPSGGFNNDTPQPQAIPQPQTTPQQNNYPTPSASLPRKVYLQGRCINASGNPVRNIGQYDSDSMIATGQRVIPVMSKVWIADAHQTTCAISRHPTSGKVVMAFAIPDNSSLQAAKVSIYVNGQEKFSETIDRGQVRGRAINITGASSYSVTLQALSGVGDIYFPRIRQP